MSELYTGANLGPNDVMEPGTVADNTGALTVAKASAGGNSVYLNGSLIVARTVDYGATLQTNPKAQSINVAASLMHEIIHNMTGSGDPTLYGELGVTDQFQFDTKLGADCFPPSTLGDDYGTQ